MQEILEVLGWKVQEKKVPVMVGGEDEFNEEVMLNVLVDPDGNEVGLPVVTEKEAWQYAPDYTTIKWNSATALFSLIPKFVKEVHIVAGVSGVTVRVDTPRSEFAVMGAVDDAANVLMESVRRVILKEKIND